MRLRLDYLEEARELNLLRLKDERGFFTQDAIKCVMKLIGEAEIPPHQCGLVIQTVAKHMFLATVPDGDLPSTRSALRFADRAQVLSVMHVAESVLECDSFDIHTDGTSRGGQKYVGQQLNIDGEVLTSGFSAVSAENTNTLVDLTFSMVQELTEVFDESEAHINFVQMLSRLSCMMTDRASVMKSFVRQFDAEVREMLQQESTLGFLHCNAHFLLGMSAECEKALSAAEKANGEKLGRDRLPTFRNFRDCKESSAARYIRTACDCLGPRGDDKNGCRDSWEGYCVMIGHKSLITSYRSNRFNNLFEAAAALHYHRAEITTCLDLYLSKRNKKLESVLADSKCDVIDCHLVALGILYYRVTGPYWQLLAKDLHYLDFYRYVQCMMVLFQRWTADPADAFNHQFEPLFPPDHFMPHPDVFESLLSIAQERQGKVEVLLKGICQGLIEVTRRQMADFLEGGKYCNVQDQQMWEKMRYARLTNLIGEKAFGDLDFSLFKRRHASLHHHSTVHMLKWNRSISAWLDLKDPSEQKRLLDLSAKKAPGLRRKHVMEEKDAVARRQIILEENHQKKLQTVARRRNKIEQVMTRLRYHKGPCLLPEDLDMMLERYPLAKDRLLAVKAELSYHKLVLLVESPLLRVTGRLPELIRNLKVFLGADPAAVTVPAAPSRKRSRLSSTPDSSDEADQEESHDDDGPSDEEHHNEESLYQGAVVLKPFEFTRLGEIIAVHYDLEEEFFIGEVEKIISPMEGQVNFLERLAIKKNVFHWPTRPDKCLVHRNFVVAGNLTVSPASSSGRSVALDSMQDVTARHTAYKEQYCM